jgi:phosphoserine phosphatase RsbU/P
VSASSQHDFEERLSQFELKTLVDSSKLILQSQDLSFVLNNLLFMIMGKLLLTRAIILLKKDDRGTYEIVRTKGRSHFREGQELFLGDAVGSGSVPSILLTERDRDLFPQVLHNEAYRTMVALQTNSEHLGWLCLGEKPNGLPISDRELEFLQTVVILPSVAISNSKLIDELKKTNRTLDQKVQELNTLFDLSKEFSQSVDRDQILRIFKFALMGQMSVRTFYLAIERNKQLEVICESGLKVIPDQKALRDIFNLKDSVVYTQHELELPEILRLNELELVLQLRLQDQRVASLCLGRRLSGEAYSKSSIDFLVSLGSLVLMSVQKTYLMEARVEKERLEKELDLARTIQSALLPTQLPDTGPVQISARNLPSRQVGGDYYDVIPLGEGRFIIAIADVTGKGIPASLIMANIQAMVHMLAPLDMPLDEKTARINDVIYRNTTSDTFVTFFWGVLDCKTLEFEYVNAGHNPPMLFREMNDRPIELTQGGLILGALPTMIPYESEKMYLKQSDLLVLFTDGITEAMSPTDEEFGEERLVAVVNQSRSSSIEEISNEIIKAIDMYCQGTYSDDVTLMSLIVSNR